jgi:hypothetical protein
MKEAMKQALEALEDAKTHGLVYVNEIVDLRQAIAEAKEQGEPVAWYVDFGNDDEPNYALLGEKPHEPTATVRPLLFGDTTSQPKQEQGEPDELTIAYMSGLHRGKDFAQQRTWVGLTDEERYEIANVPRWSSGAFVEATEAKLKQKNGYAEEKNT